MQIPLDPSSPLPLYRQIESWLRSAIASGNLDPGTRLPATRVLADELGLSRITVEKAYAELLAEGLAEGRGSGGTVVVERTRPSPPVDRARPRWQEAALARSGTAGTRVPAPEAAPDVIDLSGGLGDPGLFDLASFSRALNTVRLRDGVSALDYGDPQGYPPLRKVISGILAAQGLVAPPEQILVTAGSQQAITLVASCLLKAGDTVLVERPTYNSALELFRVLGLRVVEAPLDARGLRLDAAQRALEAHRPKLIYTMPTYQNPTGVSMDLPRRRGLLELAARYDVPVLEDDFVGDLRFEGRGHPSLKAVDTTGHVIYVSTFSKMLLPGLRTGYLVLDGPVFGLLAEHKRLTDLASATLIQRTLAEYVGVGRYQTHLKRSVRLYRRRRDAAALALKTWVPGLVWTLPAGGHWLWIEAPFLGPGEDLAALAAAAGVRLAPGGPFFAGATEASRFARLNFAALDEATVAQAIRRLASALPSRR
jgi:GntR family transcriptional regulator/MocR family aminotransferase